MRRGEVLVGVLLLGLVAPLRAEEIGCQRRVVAVSVVDSTGEVVTGLTAAEFRGEFRGQAVKIVSATLDTGPRRVVIVLDAAESAASDKRNWPLVRWLAGHLVAFAPPQFSLGLVVVSQDVVVRVGFEQGRQAVADALANFPEKGKTLPRTRRATPLVGLMTNALELFEHTEPGDALYLISDQLGLLRPETQSDVEHLLSAQSTRLFGVFLRPAIQLPAGMEALWDTRQLVTLARRTGGDGFEPPFNGPNWPEFPDHGSPYLSELRALYRAMGIVYRLEVELPREVDKPRGWNLEVVGADGKRRKEVSVLYPQKLVPCEEEKRK